MCFVHLYSLFFFFKQKTAYEMRISDWSSDVCSSDLLRGLRTRASRSWRPGPVRQGRTRTRQFRPLAAGPQSLGSIEGRRAQASSIAGISLDHSDRQEGNNRRLHHRRERYSGGRTGRSEDRRVGNEGVGTCSSRRPPSTKKKK